MTVTLYFDGSHKKLNDKKVTIATGWMAIIMPGMVIASGSNTKTKSKTYTSTHAEWSALIHGLQWINTLSGINKLIIRGDHKGVIECIKNQITPSNNIAASYYSSCKEIIEKLNVTYYAQWIRRESNWAADQLSKQKSLNVKLIAETETKRQSEALTELIAKNLWQNAGRPTGRDEEFWLKAERLIDEIN